MLNIDLWAEDTCADAFFHPSLGLRDYLLVLGEETLWRFEKQGLDLSAQTVVDPIKCRVENRPEQRLVAILDMIDGSDLIERDLENWCSAMVVFSPATRPPRILLSVVQDSRDRIYIATDSEAFMIEATRGADGSISYDPTGKVPLKVPAKPDKLGICFYAQKLSHYATVPIGFKAWLTSVRGRDALRIYTLAGNPMMVRLANGEKIHVVFEHKGQFAHDAVPGAYIAWKAGAKLIDLDSQRDITACNLASALLRPTDKLRYVLASTNQLGRSLAKHLNPRNQKEFACAECDGSGLQVRKPGTEPGHARRRSGPPRG